MPSESTFVRIFLFLEHCGWLDSCELFRIPNQNKAACCDNALPPFAAISFWILPETDCRGKIEPPVEVVVLKIERYAQKLTQGCSAYGGSYLWAPGWSNNFGLVFRLSFENCSKWFFLLRTPSLTHVPFLLQKVPVQKHTRAHYITPIRMLTVRIVPVCSYFQLFWKPWAFGAAWLHPNTRGYSLRKASNARRPGKEALHTWLQL